FDAVAAVLKDGTMPSEIIDAASVIEQAGFTIIDDLLHGYGGGYLPPGLGSRSPPRAHIPNETLRTRLTGVIPPHCRTPHRPSRPTAKAACRPANWCWSPRPAWSRYTRCRAASCACEATRRIFVRCPKRSQ